MSCTNKPKGETGQTLVETAIVLALFLALAFGIIEFGRAWFYSNHLNNSVRAAARYGAVLGNRTGTAVDAGTVLSNIRSYAVTEITSYINVPTSERARLVTVSFEPDRGGVVQRGDTITVTANLQFHVLTGSLIGSFTDFTMTRSASARFE